MDGAGYLSVVMDVNKGYLLFKLDAALVVPPLATALTCAGSLGSCGILRIVAKNWIIVEKLTAIGTLIASNTVTITPIATPVYAKTGGYPIVVQPTTSTGTISQQLTGNVVTIVAGSAVSLTVTLLPTSLQSQTYHLFTMVLTPSASSSKAVRIEIKFPSTLIEWLDPTCQVSGLAAGTSGAISCVTEDCSASSCAPGGLDVSIKNFVSPLPATAITIKIAGKTKNFTAAAAGSWDAKLYGQLTGIDSVLENVTGVNLINIAGPVAVSPPYDQSLDLVTDTPMDRLLPAGGRGELQIRFTPAAGKTIPKSTGSILVTLPSGFSLPTGASPACQLFAGDLVDDNFPQYHKRSTPGMPATCTWTSGTNTVYVTVPASVTVPRTDYVWDSAPISKCMRLVISSVGGGQPGFIVPSTPGWYSASLNTYQTSTTILESASIRFSVTGPSLTFTVSSTTTSARQPSILSVSFTTSIAIPVGYPVFVSNVQQDYATIRVELESYEGFEPTLSLQDGTLGYKDGTVIPCFGISGLNAKTALTCTVRVFDPVLSSYKYTYPINPYIEISGFEAVTPNTAVEIHIPNINNPWFSDSASSKFFRRNIYLSVLSTSYDGQITQLYARSAPTTPLPVVSNAVIPANIVAKTCTLSNVYVDGITTLTMPLDVPLMPAGSLFYVSFPATWYQNSLGSVTAQYIDTAVSVQLTVRSYSTAGILTATVPAGASIPASTTGKLVLANLLNPPYIDTCSSTDNCKIWYAPITTSTFKINQVGATNGFWTDLGLQPAQITSFTVTAPNLKAYAVNVRYTLGFSTAARVPISSAMYINFPSVYPQLSARDPVGSCTCELAAATCSIYSYGVLISGFAALPVNTAVKVVVDGVKNPTTASGASGFSILVQNINSKTIIKASLGTVPIEEPDSPKSYKFTLIPESISAQTATSYVLTATTEAAFYRGTYITLSLPADFTMPNGISCSNLKGYEVYQSCAVGNSNSVVIKTSDFGSNSPTFTVTLTGIMNPAAASSVKGYGPVTLSAVYDGTVLAVSDPTAASAFVTISTPPAQLTVTDITIMPLNAAAKITFNCALSAPFAISHGSNYAISLKFPKPYSPALVNPGDSLYCDSNVHFSKCVIAGEREVQFQGFIDDVVLSQSLTFMIFGVTNPSDGLTDPMAISLIDLTNKRILAVSANLVGKGSFLIDKTAGQLSIQNITVSDGYTGSFATYTFNISLGVSILVPNGALYVSWPTQYANLLSGNYTCSVIYGETRGNTCIQQVETFYLRTYIPMPYPSATNHRDTLQSQVVTVTLQAVPNPKSQGTTGDFLVEYVDLTAKLAKTSSYGTLGSMGRLTFSAGLYQPVWLNDTNLIINAGTWTNALYLNMTIGSLDTVKIVPSSSSLALSFTPPQVLIDYKTSLAAFQIGVANNATSGTFTVRFTKYEPSDQQRYRPIPDLTVVITRAEAIQKVVIDELPDLPVGADSAPIQIKLSQPCAREVIVEVYSTEPQQTSRVTISPNIIRFAPGDQVKSFILTLNVGAVAGKLGFTLRGEGAAPYRLTSKTAKFGVVAAPTESPVLISDEITFVGRISANIAIRLSQKAMIYYMYALQGTPAPTPKGLQTQQRVKADLKQTFGVIPTGQTAKSRINDTSLSIDYYEASIELSGLIANSTYSVFFTYMGYDKQLVPDVTTRAVTTQPQPQPAKGKIVFTRVISSEEAREGIAQTLAIPKLYITIILEDINILLRNRHLVSQSEFEFIVTAPEDMETPSPLVMVQSLDSNKALMKTFLPSLDTSSPITSTAVLYTSSQPQFIYTPRVLHVSNTSLTIESIPSTNGRVYGLMVPADSPQPTSWQIINGVNAYNQRVPAGLAQSTPCISQATATLKFTNIEKYVLYHVWLSGVNDLSGSPQIMLEKDVRMVEVVGGRSKSSPTQQTIYYSWGDAAGWVAAAWIWLFA
jgi:hypothetical protein